MGQVEWLDNVKIRLNSAQLELELGCAWQLYLEVLTLPEVTQLLCLFLHKQVLEKFAPKNAGALLFFVTNKILTWGIF